jgi:hypothetical protein
VLTDFLPPTSVTALPDPVFTSNYNPPDDRTFTGVESGKLLKGETQKSGIPRPREACRWAGSDRAALKKIGSLAGIEIM